MVRFNRISALSAALIFGVAVAALCAASPALGADKEQQTTLFVNLTSDDLWNCQMALGYAEKVHELGYPVVVFLNVRAVRLADKNLPQPRMALTGQTPREALTKLIETGITVYVCPSCAKQAGMTDESWMAGVKLGDPDMVAIQMHPMTKLMSY